MQEARSKEVVAQRISSLKMDNVIQGLVVKKKIVCEYDKTVNSF